MTPRGCTTCDGSYAGPRAFCSAKCRNKFYNDRVRTPCDECGELSHGATCKPCKQKREAGERDARHRQLETLWNQGRSMSEIAAELDLSVPGVGTLINRARAAGFDLPFRRLPAPTTNLTNDQARSIFAKAIRKGEIRRCTRCEECGSSVGVIEGHHPDYSRPLYVIWLCGPCHQSVHNAARRVVAA